MTHAGQYISARLQEWEDRVIAVFGESLFERIEEVVMREQKAQEEAQ